MVPFWYSKDDHGTIFVVLKEDWMDSPRKKYPTDGDLWVLPINFEPICIKN